MEYELYLINLFQLIIDSGVDKLVTEYFMISNKNETKCNRKN